MALQLTPDVMQSLWRISPAATAATLSQGDPVPWRPAKHLRIVSDAIRKACTGQGPKYLAVSMPPRHGKSEECSHWTPIWFLENWSHKNVILCAYGGNFAAEWGRKVRNTSVKHKDRLSYRLAEDSKASNRWKTLQGGGMATAGIGGDILGRGADLMVIDDPVKNNAEANSRTYRDGNWDWWTSTARSRLEPGAVVLVIMQRWHEDDLVGRLLNPKYNEDAAAWTEINLPMIYEANLPDGKPAPPDACGRKPGQALWPERYNEEACAAIRRGTMEDNWISLYQGRPARSSSRGNVYHEYSDSMNVMRVDRDISLPLFWSLDFNVDPMSSVIGQTKEMNTRFTLLTNEKLVTCEVLQEMALPNSNTREACQAFIEATREYVRQARGTPVKLEIFGDCSGNHRSTTSSETDWQIVRKFFYRYPEFQVTFHLTRDNPAVKDRTNAVNYALKDAEGYRRLILDPSCEGLRKDLREVKWKKDAGGNSLGVIDKSDVSISHLSDALGYVIEKKYGLVSVAGEQPGLAQ